MTDESIVVLIKLLLILVFTCDFREHAYHVCGASVFRACTLSYLQLFLQYGRRPSYAYAYDLYEFQP